MAKTMLDRVQELVRTNGGDVKETLNNFAGPILRNFIIDCTKMRMHNIVWPSWSAAEYEFDRRFNGGHSVYNQEQGIHVYAPSFCPVLRINQRGELINDEGKMDAYAWTEEEFKKFAECVEPFGGDSGRGILNMCEILMSIKNPEHRMWLANRMSREKRDLFLVTSAEEARRCVEVTEELYDMGITEWIDAWVDPSKETGEYPITKLCVGDRLVQSGNGFYCVRKDIYFLTYMDETM